MARRIIKYSNRRLYDTVRGRSITLLELSDLVASGESVTVQLKGTGEDITAVTLLQSVLERLRRRPRALLAGSVADRLLGSVRRAIDEGGGLEEIEAGQASGDRAVPLPD